MDLSVPSIDPSWIIYPAEVIKLSPPRNTLSPTRNTELKPLYIPPDRLFTISSKVQSLLDGKLGKRSSALRDLFGGV